MIQQLINIENGGIKLFGHTLNLHEGINQVVDKIGPKIAIQEQRVGWTEYKVTQFVYLDDQITVKLLFQTGELKIIELYHQFKALPEPKDWNDWTAEFEITKKKKIDEWLNDQVGQKRVFAWGQIISFTDKKAGYSGIIIRK